MSVLEIIRRRRSIRKYKDDPIPEDVLFRVLEAARLAPSGKNLQPWKFIIVRDKLLKKKLAEASIRQYFMAEAPVVIVACGFPDECYSQMGRYMKSWPVDVAIALEHLILQAEEENLGTCWIGAFEEKDVKSILGIPQEVRVLALTPIGYPVEKPPSRRRKTLGEIISYEKY
jgi:nitroreductase